MLDISAIKHGRIHLYHTMLDWLGLVDVVKSRYNVAYMGMPQRGNIYAASWFSPSNGHFRAESPIFRHPQMDFTLRWGVLKILNLWDGWETLSSSLAPPFDLYIYIYIYIGNYREAIPTTASRRSPWPAQLARPARSLFRWSCSPEKPGGKNAELSPKT